MCDDAVLNRWCSAPLGRRKEAPDSLVKIFVTGREVAVVSRNPESLPLVADEKLGVGLLASKDGILSTKPAPLIQQRRILMLPVRLLIAVNDLRDTHIPLRGQVVLRP